jgi:alpha,alpha-trehalase
MPDVEGPGLGGGPHLSPPTGRLVALWPPSIGSVGPGEAGSAVTPPSQGELDAIFPPIADYAFLSDCENTCLIAPTS